MTVLIDNWDIILKVISAIIGIVLFIRVVFNDFFVNKSTSKIDMNASNVTSLSDDIKTANKHISELTADITAIELRMASAAYDEKFKNVQIQLDDMKIGMARFQDRLEKLSDVSIKILSSRNGES